MEPHLIRQVTGPDLTPLEVTQPKEVTQAIPEGTASQLTDLMVGAERHSSGRTDIASKTGTAEHGEDSRDSNPHAWYVAFGPSQEADVAVAVLVENGGDGGQEATGGSVAAPIGRAVIDAAVKQARGPSP